MLGLGDEIQISIVQTMDNECMEPELSKVVMCVFQIESKVYPNTND